jgi:hypothetical protein
LRVYGKGFGRALVLVFASIPFMVGLIYGIIGGHAPGLEQRRGVENRLIAQSGQHLVIVRHSADRPVWKSDWVFNAADIDASKVVWARDLGDAANQELLAYYHDRKVWLLEPDRSLVPIPYPAR